MNKYELHDQLVEAGVTELDNYFENAYTGMYKGRNIRTTCNEEIQIDDGNMDRWANSVGAGFFPKKKTFQKQFQRMLKEAGVTE